MNPLEAIIGLIAPHRCVNCRQEPHLLCAECSLEWLISPPSRCYKCHKATTQSSVCGKCRPRSSLSHVWVSSEYNQVTKKLIHKLKFKRARTSARIMAETIDNTMPQLPKSVVVTFVPTANKRVRQRGYDQSKLIAKELARIRKWKFAELLHRKGSARQVGADRQKRIKQMTDAFSPVRVNSIRDAHILIIDDVLTTGATLGSAASSLKNAGANTIDGAVFTQPLD